MADIIVKGNQRTVSLDAELSRKYDIVDIREDLNRGVGYGRLEVWPTFVIVRVKGATAKSLSYLLGKDGSIRSPYHFDFDAELTARELDKVKNSTDWYFPIVKETQVRLKAA